MKIDTAQRTLIIVSTFNRLELTSQCLDSIARNKAPRTGVVILDDASSEYSKEWLEQWGWPVERRENTVGVGLAAKGRAVRAFESPGGFGFFILCDNDMIFASHFDDRLRQLWEAHSENGGLVSGYRSVAYEVKAFTETYVRVKRVGGPCLGLDRAGVAALIESIDWSEHWDQQTGKFQCLCPRRSLAQHIATGGGGVSGISWDVAYDFAGEGAW